MVHIDGIPLKKKFGQHFLRNKMYVERMLAHVELTPQSSVFEIGCGDGFLTQEIVQHPFARLRIFEIDRDWAQYVRSTIKDSRVEMREINILDVDFAIFQEHQPWTLLSNLPYQITFPLLHRLQQHRHLLKEGVIMVQEEVAQKIIKKSGKGYGFPSLFFQYYFEWKQLDKVPPSAFVPPPKIFSRLLYFKPKNNLTPIPDEDAFWHFIKACFRQPRRTLKNNMQQTQYDYSRIPAETLALRAQQMSFADFLGIWELLNSR